MEPTPVGVAIDLERKAASVNIGMLGTGTVGRTLAAALAGAGNEVMIGTRDVAALMARETGAGESFADWREGHPGIAVGTYADAAARAELAVNATAGAASLQALAMAGEANFEGKVIVDVANPLASSGGMPPSLTVVNTDSLAEQIQRALPRARVVKTLNTVNAAVMVNPSAVGDGDHAVFLCGDDAGAKQEVSRLLGEWFGWRSILDLGDLTAARGMEMYLPLWLRLLGALGTAAFNIKVVR